MVSPHSGTYEFHQKCGAVLPLPPPIFRVRRFIFPLETYGSIICVKTGVSFELNIVEFNNQLAIVLYAYRSGL